jgi:hypothetical protein
MSNNWKKVLATHEEKQVLSVGDWLGDRYPGVALPSAKALRKWVELRFKYQWTIAHVVDVGPWTTDDDAYVFGNARPRAETFKGEHARINDGGSLHSLKSNGAGIDLFPETARLLGIALNENVILEWRFIEPSGT